MKYQLRNVIFAVRLITVLFFVVLSITLPLEKRASILVVSAVYLSLVLYGYLFSLPNKPINKFIDAAFLPILSFISNFHPSIYTFIPFIIIFTPRYYPSSIILVGASFILSAYFNISSIQNILLDMLITVAAFIASTSPDFITKAQKELKSVTSLRKTADKLAKEFAHWEVTKRELKNMEILIDLSIKHADIKRFLKEVMDIFDINSITIIPTREHTAPTVKKDEENKTYTVPVSLNKNSALVVFELKNKYQLWDQSLLKTLDKVANMLNIYIEGFPDESIYRKHIKIDAS